MNNIDHLVTIQCSVRKPWVLAFMWMSLETHPKIVVDQVYLLMAMALSDDSGHPDGQ